MENKKCVKIKYEIKKKLSPESISNKTFSPKQNISLMDISFCELKTKSISDKDFAIFSTENDTNMALKTYSKNNELIRQGSCIYNDFMNSN